MTDFLIVLSYWLHSLATVVFVGHYLLLALVYLPALSKTNLTPEGGAAFKEISSRSRPWLYAAMAIFALSGTLLTFLDPNYMGIGNFSNLWAVLMLVKHLLLLGMLAAGFWYNAILRVGSMLAANPTSPAALARFRLFVNGMALSGALVLLLTAVAQIQ